MLHLSVYNDGPLLDRDGSAVKDGIGLSNLRTRLKLLYGSDCDLRLGKLRHHRRAGLRGAAVPRGVSR